MTTHDSDETHQDECPNCGEPLYRDKVRGSNMRSVCPECGKIGCTICIDMTDTKTCCCSPE